MSPTPPPVSPAYQGSPAPTTALKPAPMDASPPLDTGPELALLLYIERHCFVDGRRRF